MDLITGTLAGILKEPRQIGPHTQSKIIDLAFSLMTTLKNDFPNSVRERSCTGILNMVGQVSKICAKLADINTQNDTSILPLKSLYYNHTEMMQKVISHKKQFKSCYYNIC